MGPGRDGWGQGFPEKAPMLGRDLGLGRRFLSHPHPHPLLCTARREWQEEEEQVLGNRQVGQDPSWSKVVGEEVPGKEEGEGLAMQKGVGREENPVREQEQQVGKRWRERRNGIPIGDVRLGKHWGGRKSINGTGKGCGR